MNYSANLLGISKDYCQVKHARQGRDATPLYLSPLWEAAECLNGDRQILVHGLAIVSKRLSAAPMYVGADSDRPVAQRFIASVAKQVRKSSLLKQEM